jgi:hypothetical protein
MSRSWVAFLVGGLLLNTAYLAFALWGSDLAALSHLAWLGVSCVFLPIGTMGYVAMHLIAESLPRSGTFSRGPLLLFAVTLLPSYLYWGFLFVASRLILRSARGA